MGKLPLVSLLPKPVAIGDGTEHKPSNVALGSLLTQEEYGSAVIAVISRVEDDSEGDEKMQGLSSALRRLLLSRYDPPLPLYWTLVAVEKSLWLDTTSKDPLEFGASILNFADRALLSLKSLSAVNASGRTALSSTAPIVGLLYDVATLLNSTVGSLHENRKTLGNGGGSGKKVRKLVMKLKELIKDLLSFTALSYCKDLKAFERSFSMPPAPEVSFENFPDFLYPRLPLLSKKAESRTRDLSNAARFADIVFGEAVLLQLVIETLDRRILLKKQNVDFIVGQEEFVQRLKKRSVHSVWAASSPSEMLLDVLLEKRLPVLDLLASEEEILLRGVLFELVLIEAPLLSRFGEAGGESTSSLSGLDHSSVVFMKKLSIARRAVTFFRSQQEHSRLANLSTQITAWQVPPRLSKWLKSLKKQRLPVTALQDQQALINWLVYAAEKTVFSAILEKAVATWSSGLISVGTAENVEVVEEENGDALSDGQGQDMFFVDKAGEPELESIDVSAADLDFAAAAQAMKRESNKMKKKKKQSKVLFHRHEQTSARTKRSRIELDDVHITSSSGSDREDSEERRIKSAKKLKQSEQKAVDLLVSSEDGEYDDNDGALASAQLSREEVSSPVKSEDFSNQQVAEQPAQKTEELAGGKGSEEGADGVGSEDLAGGVGAEEFLAQPEKEAVVTSVSTNELDIRNSSTISQGKSVLLSVGKSAKKKKSKDPGSPDGEAPAEHHLPQRPEEPADGLGTVEPDDGLATEELLSQSKEEMVMTSISLHKVDSRDSWTASKVDLAPPSVRKSARKKKKSKDSGDADMEAPAELNLIEELASRVGTKELTGEVETEELASGVGTEEVADGTATEELLSRPTEEMAITTVSANEVDTRDLTTSQVDLVTRSVGRSAKQKSRHPESTEAIASAVDRIKDGLLLSSTIENMSVDGHPESDTEGKGDALLEKAIVAIRTIQAVETSADVQGEELEELSQKAASTSCEELKTRRSSSLLSTLTPQNDGSDDFGVIGDVTGVVKSASLRNVHEEMPVVKSSRKKRLNEHPGEGDEGNKHKIFESIKEELVCASANFSSADLIDALQVEKSLPADQQLSSKTKTTRPKRVRLGGKGDNTGDIAGTTAVESTVTVSALNSDKTISANEPTEDGNVSQGDVASTAEEELLSASLMNEILGQLPTKDAEGLPPDESMQNISAPVVIQVNPPDDSVVSGAEGDGPQETTRPSAVKPTKSPVKNVVEEMEPVTQGTPLKKNRSGTGTPRSRRKRPTRQTDVALPVVAEERLQPKEEVYEAAISSPAAMPQGAEGQEELEVKTPDAEEVPDSEVVASVKPSSRKRKGKPEISQLSGGSDTADEILYQRRTRSGRALGTPPPTPTRKGNMRRKLVLEPLEEEK